MRVDFTSRGVEPPDKGKTGRGGQTGASGTSGSSASSNASSIRQQHFGPGPNPLSFDQARVQSLQAQVLAQPEIRQAKVRSLQQAIGNGEYSVPASQIADALASDLSGGAQG